MSTVKDDSRPPRGMWQRALFYADRTPESRNRYVDFLRALSILAVVVGHWLISAPYFLGREPAYAHLLDLEPVDAVADLALPGDAGLLLCRRLLQQRVVGVGPAQGARLQRLVRRPDPTAHRPGAARSCSPGASWWRWRTPTGSVPTMIRIGSQVALVPVWFLAVYILVVALVPLTHAAWRRWGFASVVAPVIGADPGRSRHLRCRNRLDRLGQLCLCLAHRPPARLCLARSVGWPAPRSGRRSLSSGFSACSPSPTSVPIRLSLVGVPSDEISNTLPPKLPLLALAAAQIGLLLCFEAPARRWLAHRIPWAATILVNGMIMTIYLWHSTVMMLLVGLAFWQLPAVLAPYPATAAWWWTRPLWIARLRPGVSALPARLLALRATGDGRPPGPGVAPAPRLHRAPAPGSPPWPWAASAATAGSVCAGFPCSCPWSARPSPASAPSRGWCGVSSTTTAE